MKKLWDMINGKKTYIGIFAKALIEMIGQMKPEWAGMLASIGGYVDLWILGGFAHKISKVE